MNGQRVVVGPDEIDVLQQIFDSAWKEIQVEHEPDGGEAAKQRLAKIVFNLGQGMPPYLIANS
ncbi:hypothetical protein [Hyphomicrobium facile]|uniref:Uncharacterized protein n=1 Tax=Hyphomicrobium facile TaxID=51670 RepID=A0A1I7N1B8_9HYPH|nr:hypothetical protein [Hyphomicrobium facile]SFV28434.1 hypothetical protein SAMN04488557_1003 [Hyphomicrobium facile]